MHIYISNFCHTFSCNQLKTMKLATRKINCINEMLTKNFWTHEIPTNTRWHNGTRPTRPTRERGPQNLAHSYKSIAKHVPSKHSSWWRRLEDVFRLRLQKTSSRRLDQDEYVRPSLTSSQDVLVKTNIFALAICLQDVFKTSSRRL